MQNSTYQALPAVSASWLKDMLVSPLHCYQRHLARDRVAVPKSSAAMDFGALVHCLALTPQQFGREFALLYSRSKAERAELEATGKIIITGRDLEAAMRMVSALQANPEAQRLIHGGCNEMVVTRERERGLLPLKARIDIYHPDTRIVGELKTIHSLHAIDKAMQTYHYALSAAFYADIVGAERVAFIFVEKAKTQRVAVFELSHAQMKAGRAQYRAALELFDMCYRSGCWPDNKVLEEMEQVTHEPRFELAVGGLEL